MSDARSRILARVRDATGGAAAPPAPTRHYRRHDERSLAERVELFCERVEDYKAEVRHISHEQLSAQIGEALRRESAERVAVPPALPQEWLPPGFEFVTDQGLTPNELDKLDGVVTGCTVAIAQTGTIVTTCGPHEGRRILSLVPDFHICIVQAAQIVSTVPEAITSLATAASERRPITLISGPSATSDIELERVEGVHGPRKLVVLVIGEHGDH